MTCKPCQLTGRKHQDHHNEVMKEARKIQRKLREPKSELQIIRRYKPQEIIALNNLEAIPDFWETCKQTTNDRMKSREIMKAIAPTGVLQVMES